MLRPYCHHEGMGYARDPDSQWGGHTMACQGCGGRFMRVLDSASGQYRSTWSGVNPAQASVKHDKIHEAGGAAPLVHLCFV